MNVWAVLADGIARDGAAALVSVVAVRGSTPREAGARMVVLADGALRGSIGGGALEWQAMARAQRLLRSGGRAEQLRQSLGPDLGQCCGGEATLWVERFDASDMPWIAPLAALSGAFRTRRAASGGSRLLDPAGEEAHGDDRTSLLLFGAGHVGRALVMALAPLPFVVRWIDPRPDAFPVMAPVAVFCAAPVDPSQEVAAAPAGALLLVMTHSHALDLEIVDAALRDGRFGHLGVIGSATKRARFRSQLAAAGHAPELIERMACPIGVSALRDKAPAAIAAGCAVELLLIRERLAMLQPRLSHPYAASC